MTDLQQTIDGLAAVAKTGMTVEEIVGAASFWPAGPPTWEWPDFEQYRTRTYDADDQHHDERNRR